MRTMVQSVWRLLLFVVLAAFVGCSETGRFDVMVSLERTGFKAEVGTIPSIEVNLVGINEVEYPEWYRQSMTGYWEPDQAMRITAVRKGYAHVMTFGEEQPVQHVLYRSNAIWREWEAKGARYLYVLCNFPRNADDQQGNADPRRLVLPLEKNRWRNYLWGKRVISVEVTPSGLICHTPP